MVVATGQNLGNYRVIEQIGRGGMATVYRAFQPALSREVAIKVLPGFFAEDASFVERFRREAIAVANLRHPNILAVYDYGEQDDTAYIVTELAEGGTLADLLGAPLSVARAVALLRPVAAALDHAHTAGVIHRDVKPSNVLLRKDGTPVLSDFGLARIFDHSQRLTATGMAVGTPEYMAPEQAKENDVGPACDVYALAVVLYEMLTGSVPYSAETPLAVILAHMHNPLPLPREKNPSIGEPVQNVLLKGLAKRPEDRYTSAGALIDALVDAGPSEPAAAPSVGAPPVVEAPPNLPPPPAGARAFPRGVAAGGAAFVLVAAFAAAALLLGRSSAPGTSPQPPSGQSTTAAVAAQPTAAQPTLSPKPTAAPAASDGSTPAHGALLYELTFGPLSANANPILGNPQFDRVRLLPDAVELEVSPGSTGGLSLPRTLPEDFVAATRLTKLKGDGLYWLGFHIASNSGQHKVQVDTKTGELDISRTPRPGTLEQPRGLFGPAPRIPASFGGEVSLVVSAVGPEILVYGDGKELARAQDVLGVPGAFSFILYNPYDAAGPLVVRLSELRIYEPPAAR